MRTEIIEVLSATNPIWHFLEQTSTLEISKKDMSHISRQTGEFPIIHPESLYKVSHLDCEERQETGVKGYLDDGPA